MKYLIAILVMLPLTAAAHPRNACPNPDPILQFVGKTTATVDGQGHLLGWLPLCRTEYPGSQVCTTRDFVESAQPRVMKVGDKWWVMPYWIDSEHEYSGRFNQSASCAIIQRLIDYTHPIFSPGVCNDLHPVACCALVP